MVNAGSARKAWLGLAGLLSIFCAWLIFDAFASIRPARSHDPIPGQRSAAKPPVGTAQHLDGQRQTLPKAGPTSEPEVRVDPASVEVASTSSAQPIGASSAARTAKSSPPLPQLHHSLPKIDELIMDRQ
jgi:hypothetical protein